ncbi:MarR family winged helix-turn-helix transcriptional regulator [Melittangium boletus]|uniref:Transcriptional regulator n=1 Tax=Melittangium boletus DSM 14713 TaxID=1294270 RepID=A0A250IB49_9BACT|nr:MarR family transcriptional regulator [Melittangium boletus]ATB28430.1 transcriptional regulator [Melittangium boletus DSM 14713]
MSEQAEAERQAQGQTLSALERELSVLVRRAIGSFWGKRDEGGVDRWTYALLIRLSEEGTTRVGEVARRFGIDKSTASRHLGRMEEQGLLESIPDESDARSVLLRMTPRGAEHLAATRAERLQVLRKIFAAWPEQDRADLTRLLGRLNTDLDLSGGP